MHPSSNDLNNIVITGAAANMNGAVASVLNQIIASSLPTIPFERTETIAEQADRSIRLVAQHASFNEAIRELIEQLLEIMDDWHGAVAAATLHGLVNRSEGCSIWGVAWLGEAESFRSLRLIDVTIDQTAESMGINVRLRPEPVSG